VRSFGHWKKINGEPMKSLQLAQEEIQEESSPCGIPQKSFWNHHIAHVIGL